MTSRRLWITSSCCHINSILWFTILCITKFSFELISCNLLGYETRHFYCFYLPDKETLCFYSLVAIFLWKFGFSKALEILFFALNSNSVVSKPSSAFRRQEVTTFVDLETFALICLRDQNLIYLFFFFFLNIEKQWFNST